MEVDTTQLDCEPPHKDDDLMTETVANEVDAEQQQHMHNIIDNFFRTDCSVEKCEANIKDTIHPSNLEAFIFEGCNSFLKSSRCLRDQACCCLFAHLVKNNVISVEQLCRSLQKAFSVEPDVCTQRLKNENMKKLILFLLRENIVEFERLRGCLEVLMERGNASGLVEPLLEQVIAEKGMPYVINCCHSWDEYNKLVNDIKRLSINSSEHLYLQGVVDFFFDNNLDDSYFSVTRAMICTQLKTAPQSVLLENTLKRIYKYQTNKFNELEKCTEAENEENEKIRNKFFTDCRFLGELINYRIFSEDLIIRFINVLLLNPHDSNIKCVCTLLKTIAKVFELGTYEVATPFFITTSYKFKPIFDTIKNLLIESRYYYSNDIKLMMKEVLQLENSKCILKNIRATEQLNVVDDRLKKMTISSNSIINE